MLSKIGTKGRVVSIIVASGLLILLAYWLLTPSKLQQKYSLLRAQGLPTNAAELDKYYAVPAGTNDTTELWTEAAAAVTAAKIEQRAAKLPIVGMGPTPIPRRGQPWAELEDVRVFLNELNPELTLIRHAALAGGVARYPEDFSAGITTSIALVQNTRTMARLLTLSAHVHTHDGADRQAFEDVANVFAVSESMHGSPIVISNLVRIAIHAIGCQLALQMLPQASWSDSELKQLQTAISGGQFRQELLTAFHGERAICLETISTTRDVLFRDANQMKIMELFDTLTDGLKVSWPEAIKSRQEMEVEVQKISAGGIITRAKFMTLPLLVPALGQGLTASMRAEARQNCAIAAIAAQLYRLQHGTLPLSLADLTEFLPGDESQKPSWLADPFDGQPLRFKSEETRLLIYSIGQNLVDDGGQIESEKPTDRDLGYAVEERQGDSG